MKNLIRLGDFIDLDSGYQEGEKRIIYQLDNLAVSNLFLRQGDDILNYYINSTDERKIGIDNVPDDVKCIGDHEINLLNKILQPQYPVLCVYGRMGSGKSTTMNFIIDKIIKRIDCSNCKCHVARPDCKRLIARIDFKNLVHDPDTEFIPFSRIIDQICDRLWNKCSIYFTDKNVEYSQYWKYLMDLNDEDNDEFVEKVFGSLVTENVNIRAEIINTNKDFNKLEQIKNKIRSQDKEWYLRYLILMWRFLIITKFENHRECVFIILDNVDSLPTKIQRQLVSYIQKSAYDQGPTIILLVREETFHRLGLNDILLDKVEQLSPEPIRVLFSRLEKGLQNPNKFFSSVPAISNEDSDLIKYFLERMIPKLKTDRDFYEFIKSIAGKSIRNALLLSQGIFELPVGEMRRDDITSRHIVRAMLRVSGNQFHSSPSSHVINPFDVEGEEKGRFLTKIRILSIIDKNGGKYKTPSLISLFDYFGFMSKNLVWNAVRDMVRNECQLITSDSYDPTFTSWGDDQDTLEITEIGKGYLNYLIYDVNFIGEVMLDARVQSSFNRPTIYRDRLLSRLEVMNNFLHEIHNEEIAEVRSFMTKIPSLYSEVFGPKLYTLEIIQHVYTSIGRLLKSQKMKRPDNKEEYYEILNSFTSLLRIIEENNRNLFGIIDRTLPDFDIDQ